jgi:uncharacterized membrane protein (DUF4010 family)
MIAGLTDVDAITLALAAAAGRELSISAAGTAIAAGVLSNTAAKAAYAIWMGSPVFRRATVAVLVTAFAAGAVALFLTRILMR